MLAATNLSLTEINHPEVAKKRLECNDTSNITDYNEIPNCIHMTHTNYKNLVGFLGENPLFAPTLHITRQRPYLLSGINKKLEDKCYENCKHKVDT